MIEALPINSEGTLYAIADIPEAMRFAIIQDGAGYCLGGYSQSYVRIEVVPDSEFYIIVEQGIDEAVVRAWYASHGLLERFNVMKAFVEKKDI